MTHRTLVLGSTLVLALLAAGCGGGGQKTAQETPKPAEHAQTPAQTPAHMETPAATPAAGGGMTASIHGMVKFEGEGPTGERIKMDSDPVCKGLHTEPVTNEEVVVNGNGTLRWAMVYVKDGLGNRTFTAPTEPITLDQHGCQYKPHVFGMMAGQGVKIVNSDQTLHNIHPMPKVNKAFNVGMPKPGEIMKNFEAAEDPFHIKCDVHKWMSAYCGVFTHPFFSVTNDQGRFDLNNLPAGTYTLVAWHEKYGTQETSVTVADGESKDILITFKPAAAAPASS